MENPLLSNVLVIIVILALGYYFINNDFEHLTSESNEAIQTISSMYNNAQLTATALSAQTATIAQTITAGTLATGNASVSSNLGVNGTLNISGMTLSHNANPAGTSPASQGNITSPGRLVIAGDEKLYIENMEGVMIGKEYGGNGKLQVEGNCVVNGALSLGATENDIYPLYIGYSAVRDAVTDASGAGYGLQNSAFISTPQYQQYVQANIGTFGGAGAGINTYLTALTTSAGQKAWCSAYFVGSVVTPAVIIPSDERIKKNINKCSTFDKLDEINICSYDLIENNKNVKYGVIAQQLENILPEAVNTISNIIPDVLNSANMIISGNKLYCSFPDGKKHNFKKYDMLKVMFLQTSFELKVIDVTPDVFILEYLGDIEQIKKYTNVFIVGRRVDNFKTVDINILLYLSIGYMQQQTKKINNLENENNELKRKMEKLEKRLEKLELLIK